MFVAFHVDAYFSLGGEVLLKFIVRVEVIEILNSNWIQIGLQFMKRFENKKGFSIFPKLPWDESPFLPRSSPVAGPFSFLPHAAQSA
jgi:hypothetical protein